MLEHKENETPTLGGVSESHKSEEKETKRADILAVMIIVAIVAAVVINALI